MTEEFGNAKQDFFKQFLEPPHGIPDDRTIGRLFARLQAGELPAETNHAGGREVNIDGKAILGSGGKGRSAAPISPQAVPGRVTVILSKSATILRKSAAILRKSMAILRKIGLILSPQKAVPPPDIPALVPCKRSFTRYKQPGRKRERRLPGIGLKKTTGSAKLGRA
jgi:hypothetical protein